MGSALHPPTSFSNVASTPCQSIVTVNSSHIPSVVQSLVPVTTSHRTLIATSSAPLLVFYAAHNGVCCTDAHIRDIHTYIHICLDTLIYHDPGLLPSAAAATGRDCYL
uniref:Uncharacterized protein n=1 Tax=Mesocestoides corti TaxID=53468 RepID=A0A5K3FYQ7_MESCO